MKISEAIKKLEALNPSPEIRARINPAISWEQMIQMVLKWIRTAPPEEELSKKPLMERRFWQALKNQKRPRFQEGGPSARVRKRAVLRSPESIQPRRGRREND